MAERDHDKKMQFFSDTVSFDADSLERVGVQSVTLIEWSVEVYRFASGHQTGLCNVAISLSGTRQKDGSHGIDEMRVRVVCFR